MSPFGQIMEDIQKNPPVIVGTTVNPNTLGTYNAIPMGDAASTPVYKSIVEYIPNDVWLAILVLLVFIGIIALSRGFLSAIKPKA